MSPVLVAFMRAVLGWPCSPRGLRAGLLAAVYLNININSPSLFAPSHGSRLLNLFFVMPKNNETQDTACPQDTSSRPPEAKPPQGLPSNLSRQRHCPRYGAVASSVQIIILKYAIAAIAMPTANPTAKKGPHCARPRSRSLLPDRWLG
jgi:hypothetical protein